MSEYYDEIAEKYLEFFDNPEYKAEDKEVAKLLPKPTGKILDIGCGAGMALQMFEYLGDNIKKIDYTGLDPSIKMLEKMMERYSVKAIRGKFEEISFYEKFDLVISTYASMSYINPKDIKLLKGVLKEGGRFFLMFNKDGYEPITHSLSQDKPKCYGFSEYKGELEAISKELKLTEFNNYIIAEGVVNANILG